MLRYLIVVGTFLLALLLYIDRVCISVAKNPIAQELDLSDQQMGWVLAAFSLGYALFQTPSGSWVDRLGPRRMLAGIVSFWSLLTALTGLSWNFISLLFLRFFFGAGEAGAFPGIARATYSWFPVRERGLITGINFSGSRLGAALALPFIASLIQWLGWRASFGILGGMGIVWALLWWFFFRDLPEEHPRLSSREKDLILAQRQSANVKIAQPKITLRQLLRQRIIWPVMGQYFCSNFTFFFALTWLYPHLQRTYQLEATQAGWLASLPLLAGAAGSWLSGGWIDHLYRKGHQRWSRTIPAMVGFTLAAGGLVGSIYQEEVVGAVAFLAIALLGADMTLPPSWALCVDIGKAQSGLISGTMNMAGNLGAFLTSLAFPYLFAWSGSVTPFFLTGALLNIAAVAMWLRMRWTID
ncbi:MFS transporter [Telluribacter sp.]|jgi:ACS family glucarate transporter-like MFS transporter|uniref:MFS transporter n=1 Tax=Telluribacter sp. TaxID=1978767 RepID=UPI002E0E8D5E|nr:MFS transporter [Telluribacter sp.]